MLKYLIIVDSINNKKKGSASMKKMKFLYVLLGLALVLTGCDDGSNSNSNTSSSSGSSTPSFVTGSGTEDDPYVLYTAQHLRDLADEVNSDSYAPTEIEYFQLGMTLI